MTLFRIYLPLMLLYLYICRPSLTTLFIYLFIYLPWHEYPHMGIALSLSSFVMLSHIYRRESMYSLISAYDWNEKTNGLRTLIVKGYCITMMICR